MINSFDNIKVNGLQSIEDTAIGNPVPIKSSFLLKTESQSDNQREFLVNLGFVNQTAGGLPGADKVTLYSGITSQGPNAANGWSFNTVNTVSADVRSDHHGFGYELDFNNFWGNKDESSGGVFTGLGLTGLGYENTSAIWVSGANGIVDKNSPFYNKPLWKRGIWFDYMSVSENSLLDQSQSHTSFNIQGNHSIGIDSTSSNISGPMMRFKNGQYLAWKNSNLRDPDVVGLQVSGGGGYNNVVLALSGANAIFCGAQTLPLLDNTFPLGTPQFKWLTLYSTYHPYIESDLQTKRDIQDEKLGLDFISKLKPRTFYSEKDTFTSNQEKELNEKYHHGLVAQEVEDLLDEDSGIIMESDTGHKFLSQNQLIGPLIKAIQELKAKVELLESKISE